MPEDFIINLNKPAGISSQQAVSQVKRILHVKKAGHCGTLDPLAQGVLLVCVNKATRLASRASRLAKEYMAEIKLGIRTDTFDSEGRVLEEKIVPKLNRQELEGVLRGFQGEQEQVPPVFSALKLKGKPLYAYARQGIEVKPASRKITIYELELLELALPNLRLRLVCSSGTYVRSLINDLGTRLGCGAALTSLTRTRVGPFKIADSVSFSEMEAGSFTYLEPEEVMSMIDGENSLDN